MIIAKPEDKDTFLEILATAFEGNKSSEWVSRNTGNLAGLMDYAFQKCVAKGGAFLSDDKKAAFLMDKPDESMSWMQEIKLSIQLIFEVIGIRNVPSILKRESYIKKFHPKDEPYYYAWFLGVNPEDQGQGHGTKFIQELFEKAYHEKRDIYLETSNPKNLPLYQRFGFEIYHEWDGQGFTLWFLKRDHDKVL